MSQLCRRLMFEIEPARLVAATRRLGLRRSSWRHSRCSAGAIRHHETQVGRRWREEAGFSHYLAAPYPATDACATVKPARLTQGLRSSNPGAPLVSEAVRGVGGQRPRESGGVLLRPT